MKIAAGTDLKQFRWFEIASHNILHITYFPFLLFVILFSFSDLLNYIIVCELYKTGNRSKYP